MKLILISLAIVLAVFTTTPIVLAEHYIAPESSTMHEVKTFDSEVSRLAIKYHKDPILAKLVIKCEGLLYKTKGNNKNYDKYGKVWSEDVGWWQINNYYHEATANKLGLNIYNDWDNLEYGFILWDKVGLSAWSASKSCWSNGR